MTHPPPLQAQSSSFSEADVIAFDEVVEEEEGYDTDRTTAPLYPEDYEERQSEVEQESHQVVFSQEVEMTENFC